MEITNVDDAELEIGSLRQRCALLELQARELARWQWHRRVWLYMLARWKQIFG